MYMRGDNRLLFLLNAVRVLGKHIRKEVKDKDVLAAAVASVFSRACSYADTFVNLAVVEALEEKYPREHCAYCKHMPCECAANRKTEIQCAPVTGSQETWSIRDWCSHIDKVYGATNRERGIQFALGRLYEEICEAIDTQFLDTNDTSLQLNEVRHRMAHEFADIFAWIFTIALLLEVDIEPILEERYNKTCHRCKSRPCNCGHFSINYLSGSPKDKACSIVAH
jgi:NTP pyrophosphatase (non-canonical NTP hydrolase)